ncbi:hypothetical protein [Pseudoalteromonas denitrificans]|uniref:Cyanophycinase n=1 Tax=Pseudoalteromonas denitrificans DSM 6059 TaxID=1123010 RepID=A0A1I1PN81_9GAMM|nr:hypothetical protein [Pseudoalteromonas denitrificans]SFD11236.1 hypothetical protein SAMN02745724_03521 [Pseudoalteromonas denitrificans DSM 6059]
MSLRKIKIGIFVGLFSLVDMASSIAATPDLFLFGQGLSFCASDNMQDCSKEKKESGFSDNSKQPAIYSITDDALTRLSEFPWTEQPELKLQTIALLKVLKPKLDGKKLNERLFVRLLRRENLTYLNEPLKGRDIWSNLFEFEKRNLFDLLEQKQSLSSGKRLITAVDIKATENQSSLLAYNAFYKAAVKIAGKKRKPRIAFITGNDRDPYKRVDYLKALFEDLGFEATWLPVDAAMQTALAAKQYDLTACDSLEEFQIKKLASYRRKILYPDLFKQQLASCKKKNEIVDNLKKSDALFIADGSALLSFHSFYTPTGEKSDVLLKLEEMLQNKQIILGLEGDSIHALSNRSTIFSGDGLQVMLTPSTVMSSGNEACSLGLDCISLEAERNLGYLNKSILNVFPWGVFDTQISSLARQPRLIKTALETDNRFAFGLDKLTSIAITSDKTENGDIVEFTVLGKGGFWVFDTSKIALTDSLKQELITDEFTSYYLTHQDKMTLRNKAITVDFASWKYTNNTNTQSPTVTSSQPFARYNFYKLNKMLCNTGALEAKGSGDIQGLEYTLLLKKDASSTSRKGLITLDNKNLSTCSFASISSQIKILN